MTGFDKPQSLPESASSATREAAVPDRKRPYGAPALTRYGSVDDLVDSGVVGPMTSTVPG
jgi:hypothetical protein